MKNKLNLDELLEKAKEGEITKDEITAVVQRIEQGGDCPQTLYTLLHTLGRSGAKEYKHIMEKFLYYPAEPMISAIALRSLCKYWHLSDDYIEEVKKFAKGVEWDEMEDIRIIAISIAGNRVREKNDKECLKLLLTIFENEQENTIMLSGAYEALARGIGKEWNEIPSVRALATLSEDVIDQEVIKQAYNKLLN